MSAVSPPSHIPEPSKKLSTFSAPLVYVHTPALFQLRDSLPPNAVTSSLVKSLVRKVISDDTVHSVTFSKRYGPGGPHAFLSYAPYYHPDPKQQREYLAVHPNAQRDEWEDRIEWVHRDGKRCQDVGYATQGEELNAMSEKVFALALAYHFSIRFEPAMSEKYAAKAHKLLWVFFGDPATAMDPEVICGQYVRGRQPKKPWRAEGLLHVRALAWVSQVLPLLPAPPSPLSPHAFMHAWLSRHVDFLLNHELGREAIKRPNNIGTHYLVLLTTHLVALGRSAEAHAHIQDCFLRGRLAQKIDAHGVPVREVTRTLPFHYVAFELEPLTYLASLAAAIRQGQPQLPDLWSAESHALRRAFDFATAYYARHIEGPTRRPLPPSVQREPEQGTDVRSLAFPARALADRYGRPAFQWLIGHGTVGELEPPRDKPAGWQQGVQFRGWNVKSRALWAILHAY